MNNWARGYFVLEGLIFFWVRRIQWAKFTLTLWCRLSRGLCGYVVLSSVKISGLTRKQNFMRSARGAWRKVKYRKYTEPISRYFWYTDNKYRLEKYRPATDRRRGTHRQTRTKTKTDGSRVTPAFVWLGIITLNGVIYRGYVATRWHHLAVIIIVRRTRRRSVFNFHARRQSTGRG